MAIREDKTLDTGAEELKSSGSTFWPRLWSPRSRAGSGIGAKPTTTNGRRMSTKEQDQRDRNGQNK